MKRRLFTILSALSLVLCLACAGMWVRSGWITDCFVRLHGGGGATGLVSARGGLAIMVWDFPDDLFTDKQWIRDIMSSPSPPWVRLWPSWTRDVTGSGVSYVTVIFPFWLLMLPTGILPGSWWGRRWRARRSRELGLCVVCGYDLRASPERCPECGTAVPSHRESMPQ